MKVLVIIPARKGSKRLKRKNVLKLNKKPLVQITIEFAKKLRNVFDIIVSTDDPKIINISKKLNVKAPFLRPAKLANDNSSSYSVCAHAINFYEKKYTSIDTILLLQPTSPFRSRSTIETAIKNFNKVKSKSVASVQKLNLNPLSIIEKKLNKNYFFLKNKNDLFKINGNFYLIEKKLFFKKKRFFLPNTYLSQSENFQESIDIDDMNDLKIAKSFL